ncbi:MULTISPECIES: SDR family oxidoreductase [Exiguobacterium]|uniref:SDR family oxidoreductase n=1 Tax=Exiguobacterium TaxID=33986 RepID=UPI000496AA8B|nr:MULTISPECIES: SDR family oxidoreductase [Exiguobacterium]TCI71326.1 SDR family oxidoreductase [Exiguobacterium sp. IPCI3]TCI81304.1 SDR family oxidoreductase [Exiguobacterium sp. IPCH1]TCI82501.1 SDR family oxidoreductase [Exiguobacterium sp. IPBC4]
MKYLVTGATGKLGSKIVDVLLKSVPASELAVSVRNPEKAEALKAKGVDVRHGDFDKPETLDEAFKGVERLLIISADGDNDTRIRQHANAVEAAERAGVSFIAYTSLADATESQNLMAPPHVETEGAIERTGIPHAFLRNNWYLENELGSIQGVLAGAPWVTAARDGKVGWALQEDYAEAIANVLMADDFEQDIFELSGPLHTQAELVEALSEVLGREVALQEVSNDAYAGVMRGAGVPEGAIPIVVGIQDSIRNGSLEVESNDFELVLGRPVTPLKEALQKLIATL